MRISQFLDPFFGRAVEKYAVETPRAWDMGQTRPFLRV